MNIYGIKVSEKDMVVLYAALLYLRDNDEILFKDALFDLNVTIEEFNILTNSMSLKLDKILNIEDKKNSEKVIN